MNTNFLSRLKISHRSRSKGQRGQILLLAAVSLPVIMGFTGLALDIGLLTMHRTQRQRTADAAALAGAQYLAYNPDDEPGARSVACSYANKNGYGDGTSCSGGGQVTVNLPPTAGPHSGDHKFVEVKIQKTDSTFFIRVLPGAGNDQVTVQARAVGGATPRKRNYALIVLDPTKCDAFSTSSNITINGGGAIDNSNATTGGSCVGESAVQNGGSIVTAQTCYDASLNVIDCTLDYHPSTTWTIPNNSSASPTPTIAPPFVDPLSCGPPAGNQSAEYCPRPVGCPDTVNPGPKSCAATSTTLCNTSTTPVSVRCIPISITACGNQGATCTWNKRSTGSAPNGTHLTGAGDVTLEPGTYFGGLDINSNSQTVHFKPGIYVFAGTEKNGNGGGFSYQAGNLCGVAIAGNNCPVATDVTFFNTGNPYLAAGAGGSCGAMKITGSGILKFAAPTVAHTTNLTGYKNMLFWQTDSCTAQFQYAGSGNGSSWSQTGIMYLPSAEMKVTGGGNFGSVQIIVKDFTQGGSQAITINFTRYIDTDTLKYQLVE